MNPQEPQNNNQEIDLVQISKKLNDFLDEIKASIYRGIQFFVRNRIIFLILVVLGFGLGWYLEGHKKTYKSVITVVPNFSSVDYLYSKIELLQSKVVAEDTLFLKEIVGIKDPKNLLGIKIRSITDVYSFIKSKPENFELIKLLAEDGDVNKVIESYTTSKNYSYKEIIVSTKKKIDDEKVIKPLLAYLNKSDYYDKIKNTNVDITNFKIKQNDSIIKQIDGILSNFSIASKPSNKSDKLLYNNENSQINDIIKTKADLLTEQGKLKIELIGLDKIIKDIDVTLNIELSKFKSYHSKFILPLLFIFLFIGLNGFVAFYKRQRQKIAG